MTGLLRESMLESVLVFAFLYFADYLIPVYINIFVLELSSIGRFIVFSSTLVCPVSIIIIIINYIIITIIIVIFSGSWYKNGV